MDRVFNREEKAKLTQLVNEGLTVMQEVDDLNEGLNDTIKAIAEEMQIKPSMLKKVITVAFKRNMDEERDKFEELEDIIDTLGLK